MKPGSRPLDWRWIAFQGLLVREALPPRLLRALLEPFDEFVDGLTVPTTDGPARR